MLPKNKIILLEILKNISRYKLAYISRNTNIYLVFTFTSNCDILFFTNLFKISKHEVPFT